MTLDFRKFQREHYEEYASWFVDPELNRRLGPMDMEWLDAILSEPEAEGVTWAVFRAEDLVAVVETVFDPAGLLPMGVTAIAVKPALRRQGIGRAAFRGVLKQGDRGSSEIITFIEVSNLAAARLAETLGFTRVTETPNGHGYHDYLLTNPSTQR